MFKIHTNNPDVSASISTKELYSEGIFVPAAATPKVDDSAQRIALPEQIIE
jgi:hypothetical protein